MTSGHLRSAGNRLERQRSGVDMFQRSSGDSAINEMLRLVAESFECLGAAIFHSGTEADGRMHAFTEYGGGERIDFNDPPYREAISKCLSSGTDVLGSAEIERKEDIFALQLKRDGAVAGVLLLVGPAKNRDGIGEMANLLRKAVLDAFDSEDEPYDFVHVLHGTLELATARLDAVERLQLLTELLQKRLGTSSMQLYREVNSMMRLLCSAGSEARTDSMYDIQEAVRSGVASTKLRLDPVRGSMLTRFTVPVNARETGKYVLLMETQATGRAAELAAVFASEAYSLLLVSALNVSLVSAEWKEMIETMESAAVTAAQSADPSSKAVLHQMLERLRDKGFISEFAVYAAEEAREKRPGTRSHSNEISGDGDRIALVAACIENSSVAVDESAGRSLAFPVLENDGHAYGVWLEMNGPGSPPSDSVTLRAVGRSLELLTAALISQGLQRRQNQESGRLKAGALAFLDVSRAIANTDTAQKLISRCSEGISIMTGMEAHALIREFDSFRALGNPGIQDIPAESVMSALALAREVAPFIYDLGVDAAFGPLAALSGSERNDRLYILTLNSLSRDIRGIIVCPSQKSYFLSETREATLSGVASLANIRMNAIGWADRASLETRKLKKLDEVISKISLSEGDNSIVSSIVDAAAELTNSEMATVAILDVEKNRVVSDGMSGVEPLVEAENRDPTGGVAGRILRTMEAEIVNDYTNDPDRQKHAMEKFHFKRVAGVPIRIDVKQRGVLMAVNTRDGAYSADHLKTLELLSNIASSAMRATNARNERRRIVSDFDSIQSAELKLYSSKNFGEFISLLAEEVKTLFHANAVVISSEVNHVKRIMYSTSPDIEEGDVVYNSSPVGLQFDEALHSPRILERVTMEEEWANRLDIRELLLVRAGMQHNTIVIAAISGEEGTKYGTEDIENFRKISKIASTALEKTRILSGINQQLKHLEIMHNIVDALVFGKKDYEIFDGVLQRLVEMCTADVGLLWKYEEDMERVTVTAEHYRNKETEHLVGYEVSSRKGIVGGVVLNRMPVIIANAAIDNKAVHIRGTNVERFESVLGVPLIVRDKLLGVLMVYRDNPPPFTSEELDMLTNVSNDISLVMAKHSIEKEGRVDNDWRGTD